jgi:aspartyl protease family protein
MTTEIDPGSLQLLAFGVGALFLLIILTRVPLLGAAIRILLSLGLIGLVAVLLLERAPFDPTLAKISSRLNLDSQEVVGGEVRIRMAPSGHFFAKVRINGVPRRMMIDSGATVTALSVRTAAEAGLKPERGLVPVVLQTANGMAQADTATVDTLRVGAIVARDLKVVVSPAFGNMDLLGMNFLSKLKSWRVEGRTLILVPHHPQPVEET